MGNARLFITILFYFCSIDKIKSVNCREYLLLCTTAVLTFTTILVYYSHK
jgi:hypothetical protein